ncbi:MAG: CCA tRNA nucleotidyltransferase [Acetivibrio ethanolgignens]
MEIPDKVAYIITTLMEHGFEAYAVGGCVRDTILGRIPGDWDITTSARPEQVKELFKRTIDTGIQHGTVTVMLEKEGFEVTTYRIDGEYEDSRHPKSVEFTTNLIEDLKRRDFTINAMAYNPATGIVDAFDGMGDMERRLIRCVGEAEERFDEDALRMLRAVRFAGQLGFSIHEDTKKAICKKAETLKNISAERIRVELDKLLTSQNPGFLMTALETGMTQVILPEWDAMAITEQNNPHHIYSVGGHTIKVLEEVQAIWKEQGNQEDKKGYSILCWAAFLHDCGKPQVKSWDEKGIDHFYGHDETGSRLAREILRRLKFDNYTIDMVTRLVKWHDYCFDDKPVAVRRAASKIGTDLMEDLFLLQRADILGQNPKTWKEKLSKLSRAEKIYQEIREAGECLSLKELQVNGKDLIKHGFAPGKELGEILAELLAQVLKNPEKNEKEILLSLAEEYRGKV